MGWYGEPFQQAELADWRKRLDAPELTPFIRIGAWVGGDRTRLTAEAADVIFHLLVMLAARDLTLAEVEAELDRRAGTSGIAEKATRPS